MQDEIISANDIYMQDVVCSVVCSNPQEDDLVLYNKIITMINVEDIKDVDKILNLIKTNKIAIQT